MTFPIVVHFMAIPAALLLPVWTEAQLKTVADDRPEVVQTVRAFLNVLEASDEAQFTSVVTPDSYSFEGGTRFSGQAILSFIKAERAAWKSHKWNVIEADVHVIGNTAWIAYLNTDSSGSTNQVWLESAFLEKQRAGWKIVFLHSSGVPE
jgi:ketosteroid isomerase-like protein